MEKPMIHRNGTARETLLDVHMDAVNALQTAIEAVTQAEPHARDYITQGANYKAARDEHRDRLGRLAQVKRELEELASHIADS